MFHHFPFSNLFSPDPHFHPFKTSHAFTKGLNSPSQNFTPVLLTAASLTKGVNRFFYFFFLLSIFVLCKQNRERWLGGSLSEGEILGRCRNLVRGIIYKIYRYSKLVCGTKIFSLSDLIQFNLQQNCSFSLFFLRERRG